jgi:hypothetical protein
MFIELIFYLQMKEKTLTTPANSNLCKYVLRLFYNFLHIFFCLPWTCNMKNIVSNILGEYLISMITFFPDCL